MQIIRCHLARSLFLVNSLRRIPAIQLTLVYLISILDVRDENPQVIQPGQ